jgi:hypothetical protein
VAFCLDSLKRKPEGKALEVSNKKHLNNVLSYRYNHKNQESISKQKPRGKAPEVSIELPSRE